MLKLMKRASMFFLLVLFIFTNVLCVTAAEEVDYSLAQSDAYTNATAYLMMMGIVSESDLSDVSKTEEITMGKAAELIVRSLGYYNESSNKNEICIGDGSDISEFAVGLGILKKAADGSLNLGVHPTVSETTDLFLNALGYEGLAKVSNDDSVYVKYATSVKADLAQNISADFASKITYSDFMIMLYNAFDIKVVEQFMDKVEISRRLEDVYLNNMEYVISEGVLDAYGKNGVISYESIDPDYAVVNGQLFKSLDSGLEKYVGFNIRFVCTIKPKIQTIIGFCPSERNNTVSVKKNEYHEYKDGTVFYQMGEKEEKIRISDNVSYIYNERALTDYNFNLDEILEKSDLYMIDNNDDNVIDVIKIKNSQNNIVNTVSKNNGIILLRKPDTKGSNIVSFDEDDEYETIVVNVNGTAATLGDLKSGSPITVIKSLDGSYMKIIILDKPIYGKISELASDYVVIGEEKYGINTELIQLSVGMQGLFYVDEDGIIFDFKADDENDYAYVIDKAITEGLSSNAKIKIYDNNVGLQVLEIAPKASVYGSGYKSAKEALAAIPKETVVKIKKNSDGQVVKVDSVQTYGGLSTRSYCEYANGFNQPKNEDIAFRFDENTEFFTVPKNGNDDDFGTLIDYEDEKNYTTQAYEYDADTGFVKAVMVVIDTESLLNESLDNSSDIAIVAETRHILNDEGEDVHLIKGYYDGEAFEYKVSDYTNANQIALTLKPGDVIRFNKNYNDEILKIKLVSRIEEGTKPYHKGRNTEDEQFYGTIMDVEKNTLTNNNKYLQHNITMSEYADYNAISLASVCAHTENTQNKDYEFNNYYIYDIDKETVSVASIDDIITYKDSSSGCSMVFMQIYKAGVQMVVIVK